MATVTAAPSVAAVTLSPQQIELQAKIKQFADQEVRPISAEFDAIEDPIQCFPWDLWRKASRLGYRTLTMPPEYGGIGMDILTHCVLMEELCVADAGFGATLHQVWKLQPLLLKTDYLKQEILPKFLADDDYQFCLGITEPDAGQDNLIPYTGADGGSRTRAIQQPNGDWVINGKKQFQSVGGVGKGTFLLCRTDPTKGMHEGATFIYVDGSNPGFRFGHVFNKLGWRLLTNSELIFEDVRVPDGARIGEVNKGLAALGTVGKPHAPTTSCFWIGSARRAFEDTFERCKHLTRHGRPVADDQTVQMRLADMWTEVEVARTITWKAAWSADHNPGHDIKIGMASQLYSAEMSIRVCANAMQLWGKDGFHVENPVERVWRDAFVSSHGDGLNDVVRMKIYRSLAGKTIGGYIG